MYGVIMLAFVVSSFVAFEWGKFMIKYRESEFEGAFWYFLFFSIVSIASMVYLIKGDIC